MGGSSHLRVHLIWKLDLILSTILNGLSLKTYISQYLICCHWQFLIGGYIWSVHVIWKFEHTCCFMLCFTEVFSTKDQSGTGQCLNCSSWHAWVWYYTLLKHGQHEGTQGTIHSVQFPCIWPYSRWNVWEVGTHMNFGIHIMKFLLVIFFLPLFY